MLVINYYGAFTLDVKSFFFNENLGGILRVTQCLNGL
jgi:hypothetical protein